MKIVLAFLLSMLMAPMALAQPTGPNGGILGGSGDHQTELVVTPTELTVYIIEHGKAHSTKGTSLRAVVQQGGKSTTVPLADVEGKKLVGRLDAPLGAGTIVVVTGKDDHGAVLTGRFTIK